MSTSEASGNDFRPVPATDLTRLLADHVAAGFPPDLALDLVLNELVVQAADATSASAAALALFRGEEMVCRASTGRHAPDLGVPLNTLEGLSGACVRTHQPQICTDAESDPRIDPAVSHRLNVRSMLVVPVFSEEESEKSEVLIGVLEIFSPLADAFGEAAQQRLQEFARECAIVCSSALQMHAKPRPEFLALNDAGDPSGDGRVLDSAVAPGLPEAGSAARRFARQPYEGWTLALGALAIAVALGVSFLIGSRIGWFTSPSAVAVVPAEDAPQAANKTAPKSRGEASSKPKTRSASASPASPDELVVYENGRVVFRMKPRQAVSRASSGAARSRSTQPGGAENQEANENGAVVTASSSARIPSPKSIWLAPAQAENRLLNRVEPSYPVEARASHRAGNVVLEVSVADDGSVSNVRPLSGDPVLAAAASRAVRSWRYQPYSTHGSPAEFQTEVTLKFALPE